MPYVVRHRICISGCRLRMASIRGNQCAMTNDMSGLGQRGFESPNLVALRACRLCDLSYVLPRWLEPRTLRLFVVRFNQLSYERKRQCIDTCVLHNVAVLQHITKYFRVLIPSSFL
jgi:hypothetical protein